MKKYAPVLVILGSALWGTDALFRRPLTGSLSPITIVTAEHFVLAFVMLPVLIRRRHEFHSLTRRDLSALAFISLGASVTATSLFTFAMKYGNPSVVILLQKTQPLFTVLLARILLGERPARRFWRWFAVALAGAYLVSIPDWQAALPVNPGHPAVVLSALGAACLWGSATVAGRYMVTRISAPFLTALRFLLAIPALMILYRLQPLGQRELPAGIPSATAIVAMALIPGLAALLLYYKGLRSTSASLASICELAFPLTAVILNWILLHALLSPIQIGGSIVLVTAVTVLARQNAGETAAVANIKPKLIDA